MDMFVIYDPVYQQLRQSLADAVNSQHSEEELQQAFKVIIHIIHTMQLT